ncbi:MAG: hypothetical protein LBQ90_02945, partial [Synergistaceae bacterium]|nr:hypothetical protein [Synergistaceae bacterium]
MTEVLDTSALPKTLLRLIKTDKVIIHEAANGVISLTPVDNMSDSNVSDSINKLFGKFAGVLSVDEFMERKEAEKELE